MANNGIVTLYNDLGYPDSAGKAVTLSASGGVQVVKNAPGRLARIIVTVATTVAAVTVYDNASAASGLVLAVIPAATAAGTVYDLSLPAFNGITVNGAASAGQITVGYS
jgi:hypothetical protein